MRISISVSWSVLASLGSSGFLVAAGVSGEGLAVADLDVSPYRPCPAGIKMVPGGTAVSEEGDGGKRMEAGGLARLCPWSHGFLPLRALSHGLQKRLLSREELRTPQL